MAICRAKRVPLFLSHFKTLSVGPVPRIEPATTCSAVKRSTDWARPCLGFYYISALFLFNLAKISFNLKTPKRDLKQTVYTVYTGWNVAFKYPKIKEPVQPAWQRKIGSYTKQSFQFWWSKLSILIVWETFDKRLLCICILWIIFVWIVTRSLFP